LITLPLTLFSGRQEVTLNLPQIFHLDVLAEDEAGNKGFYLRRLDGPSGHSYAGPVTDGRFRFEGLVAGEYVLSRHLGPREHMPLTITGDRTVRFRPIVLAALRIEIADAAGPLARSGLRHGDLVLKINGTEITTEQQGYRLLQAAVKKGRADLTIRRDGKVIGVEADLSSYRDPGNSGGEIRPWRR
jgi:S1-C subfamily serine protease